MTAQTTGTRMDSKRLTALLARFPKSSIMVIGDIMLDEYLEGTVERISPEAPIPIVNLINNRKRDVRLGGAANVFNNLVSLGSRNAFLCGVIGNDQNGNLIQDMLQNMGAETEGLIVDDSRPTSVKTRVIAHNQQMVRLDREDRTAAPAGIRAQIVRLVKERLDTLDAIIFSDYEKGVINRSLLDEILPAAARKGVIVAVDPKFSNFRYFKKATVVVPNRKEASGFVRHEIISEQDALAAARNILDALKCACVLVKLGEHGMLLVGRAGHEVLIQTAAEQVYDVTGAGDTVISTLVLAKTAGASWEEAARIANVAAGIVIHFIGTTAVSAQQLKRALLQTKALEP
jgi:D-beta-D-heptose 7-phosphate kinase/D-beta-D-heptose 1-phosphate adenosyltransferase